MPRNSNGVYSLPAGNPVISGTVIESEWANSTMEDIAEALTWSLDRRGFGGMTVPLYFADGTEALPGAAWDNEKSTGFYRAALGDVRVSVLGQDLFRWWQGEAYVWDEANNIWQRVVASNSIDVDSSGNVTFNNNVNVEGDITVDGALVLTGDTTIDGTLVVEGENINMIIAGSGALNRPYRYWKVDEIESSSLYLALSEIRLALNGVDNLQVGTTFTVDGMVGTPLAGTGRLNDGETDLDYVINGTPDGDFSALSFNWDFTNPKALSDISQFPADVFTPGYMTAFTVSASDDGVTWTKLARFSDLTATLGEYSSRNYMFNTPGIGEAPIDGNQYARKDAAWEQISGGSGGGGVGGLLAPNTEWGTYTASIGVEFATLKEVVDFLIANPNAGVGLNYVQISFTGNPTIGFPDYVYLPRLGYPVVLSGGGTGFSALDFGTEYVGVFGDWYFDNFDVIAAGIEVWGKFGFAFGDLTLSTLETGEVTNETMGGQIFMNWVNLDVDSVMIYPGCSFVTDGPLECSPTTTVSIIGARAWINQLGMDYDSVFDVYDSSTVYINTLYRIDVFAAPALLNCYSGSQVSINVVIGDFAYSHAPNSHVLNQAGAAIWVTTA